MSDIYKNESLMAGIRLPGGQRAALVSGRVEVLPEAGRRYRLTVAHVDGGTMCAVARDYGQLIDFLHQTERLHYQLRSLEMDPQAGAEVAGQEAPI